MTAEEFGVLLFLSGYAGETSVLGIAGCADADDDGFDFGVRGLISRGIAVPDESGLLLADVARWIANCVCRPTMAGLVFGVRNEDFDAAVYSAHGDFTSLLTIATPGVVSGTMYEADPVDVFLNLAAQLSPTDSDREWSVGVRIQPFDHDPIDIVAGPNGSLGSVRGGVPTPEERQHLEAHLRSLLTH
jgi:hypothetical protein